MAKMAKPKEEETGINESQPISRKMLRYFVFKNLFFVDIKILCRELCHKTNFSSRKIKDQYEQFNRHFPIGTIEKDDIEEPILTLLPEKYCYTIRCTTLKMCPLHQKENYLYYLHLYTVCTEPVLIGCIVYTCTFSLFNVSQNSPPFSV